MNRRKFLVTGGAGGTMLAAGALRPRHLFAQNASIDTTNIIANTSQVAIMTARAGVFQGTLQDWSDLGLGLKRVRSDWQNNNMDALLQSSYQNINPASISSANLAQQQIFQALQAIEPDYSYATFQNLLNIIDAQPTNTVGGIVGSIQQDGVLPWIQTAVGQADKMALYLERLQSASGGGGRSSRGSYNCGTDGALIVGSAVAFATLAVMALPAAVLEFAIWESISFWGGISTVGWTSAHVISGCSF